MEKRTLDQAKELVNNSFPSIFSKEDVTKLLESIESPEQDENVLGKFSVTEDQMIDLAQDIASQIEDAVDDVVDTSDADFDISVDYDRRLEIAIDGGITINTTPIEEIVYKALQKFIEEMEEKEE
jgi:frataxin-like iron-binding protein CyaY